MSLLYIAYTATYHFYKIFADGVFCFRSIEAEDYDSYT